MTYVVKTKQIINAMPRSMNVWSNRKWHKMMSIMKGINGRKITSMLPSVSNTISLNRNMIVYKISSMHTKIAMKCLKRTCTNASNFKTGSMMKSMFSVYNKLTILNHCNKNRPWRLRCMTSLYNIKTFNNSMQNRSLHSIKIWNISLMNFKSSMHNKKLVKIKWHNKTPTYS